MRKSKRILSIFIAICIIAMGSLVIENSQINGLFKKTSSELFDTNTQSLEEILNKTSTIKIQKKFFSLKKHYYISVDNVVIGEVTGKVFPIFGDKLILKDSNGNIVKSESQIKRIGPTSGKLFNLSFDRLAQIKDSKGSITGYIGEEKLKDFWKLSHRQYFYNENTEKLGSAKPDFFILSKDYTILDNNKDIDYIIDGNIFSLTSKATITKNDNSQIAEEDVIFYTIIENSIIDSKTTKSTSNTTTKTKR
ncbi:MAG: hypothetical protein RRZ84_06990 [Romboutsia sp.]